MENKIFNLKVHFFVILIILYTILLCISFTTFASPKLMKYSAHQNIQEQPLKVTGQKNDTSTSTSEIRVYDYK